MSRWQNGSSHFFPSGGFRYEQDRATGASHQEIGHVEWDFTQHLAHGLSLESQGFVLIRKEDLVVDVRDVGYVAQLARGMDRQGRTPGARGGGRRGALS